MSKKYVNYLGVRMEPKARTAFVKKAAKFGGTSEVLRELVAGFVEDRVVITPPQPSGIFATTEKGN